MQFLTFYYKFSDELFTKDDILGEKNRTYQNPREELFRQSRMSSPVCDFVFGSSTQTRLRPNMLPVLEITLAQGTPR